MSNPLFVGIVNLLTHLSSHFVLRQGGSQIILNNLGLLFPESWLHESSATAGET